MPWGRRQDKDGNSSKQQEAVAAKHDALPPSVALAQSALQEAGDKLKKKILELDPNVNVDIGGSSDIEAKIEEMLKVKKFDDSKKSSARSFLEWVRKVLPIVQGGLNFASV